MVKLRPLLNNKSSTQKKQPKPTWRRGKRAGLITPRSLDRNESSVNPLLYHHNYIIMLPYFILRAGGYIAYYSIYLGYVCVYRLLNDPLTVTLLLL